MKKVLLIALAVVMALGCVSAFAAGPARGWFYGKVGFDKTLKEATYSIGESFVGELDSEHNEIREDWTNSRYIDDANAIFVNVGTDDAPDAAVKVTGTCYASGDCTSSNNLKAYVDMKFVKDGKFAGLVMDQTAGLGSGDGGFDIRADGKFILTSGYGFSLRAGNKLDAFISASATGSFDYVTVDLGNYGIDSTKWNTYTIYRTTDKVAYVAVNDILVATIGLVGTEGGPITEAGNPANTTLGNGDRYNENGSPFFGVVGDEETEIYFDNIGYEEFTDLPKLTRTRDFDKATDGLSWDILKVNGTDKATKNADCVLPENRTIDNTNGDVEVFALQGWFNTSEAVVERVGTQIDDGEIIWQANDTTNGLGLFARADLSPDTYPNATGYYVKLFTADLPQDGKAHALRVVAELANGTIVKLNRMEYEDDGVTVKKDRDVRIDYKAPAAPGTGDSFAVVAVVAVAALALVVLKKKETI